MKKIIFLFSVLAVFLTSCSWNIWSSYDFDNVKNFEFSYSNKWIEYAIFDEINIKNKEVHYSRNDPNILDETFFITEEEKQEIIKKIEKSDFFSFEDNYFTTCPDVSDEILSLKLNDKKKSISFDSCSWRVEKLRELRIEIKNILDKSYRKQKEVDDTLAKFSLRYIKHNWGTIRVSSDNILNIEEYWPGKDKYNITDEEKEELINIIESVNFFLSEHKFKTWVCYMPKKGTLRIYIERDSIWEEKRACASIDEENIKSIQEYLQKLSIKYSWEDVFSIGN